MNKKTNDEKPFKLIQDNSTSTRLIRGCFLLVFLYVAYYYGEYFIYGDNSSFLLIVGYIAAALVFSGIAGLLLAILISLASEAIEYFLPLKEMNRKEKIIRKIVVAVLLAIVFYSIAAATHESNI